MLNKNVLQQAISKVVTDIVNADLDISNHGLSERLLKIAPEITNFYFLNGWSGWSDGEEEYPLAYCAFGSISFYDTDMFDGDLLNYCYNNSRECGDAFESNALNVSEITDMLINVEIDTEVNEGSRKTKLPFTPDEASVLAKLYVFDNKAFYEYIQISGKLAEEILSNVDDVIPLHKWYTTSLV